MMGISLFGTCTMKYNPRACEEAARAPDWPRCTRCSPTTRCRASCEIIHDFDLILRELSGMDQFIFQAGGGADAAYTHCVVTRAYHRSRGELAQRNEIVTSIQAHPCNAATAAAAGFKVVTLTLEENGYPSTRGAEGRACPNRTAALMVNNPDDMGIYNPDDQGVGADRPRGGRPVLLRPRQFQRRDGQASRARARLRRLHVHAAQDLRRAQGRRRPGGRGLWLHRRAGAVPARRRWSSGRVRATVSTTTARKPPARCASSAATSRRSLKAYAWARAMGADGIDQASDLSVLANNYMDKQACRDPRPRRVPIPTTGNGAWR